METFSVILVISLFVCFSYAMYLNEGKKSKKNKVPLIEKGENNES